MEHNFLLKSSSSSLDINFYSFYVMWLQRGTTETQRWDEQMKR